MRFKNIFLIDPRKHDMFLYHHWGILFYFQNNYIPQSSLLPPKRPKFLFSKFLNYFIIQLFHLFCTNYYSIICFCFFFLVFIVVWIVEPYFFITYLYLYSFVIFAFYQLLIIYDSYCLYPHSHPYHSMLASISFYNII